MRRLRGERKRGTIGNEVVVVVEDVIVVFTVVSTPLDYNPIGVVVAYRTLDIAAHSRSLQFEGTGK
jgi:hypothetical protein